MVCCTRRILLLATSMLGVLGGCLQPASHSCDNGGVCPAELQCARSGDAQICVLPGCGNGRLDPGESCDDGNNTSGDECPADCFLPRSADCIGNSTVVAGGMFYRGYDQAGDQRFPEMRLPATVSTFRLDKCEVTVGQFREFLDAGRGTRSSPPSPGAGAHPNIPGSGWDTSWNASLEATKSTLLARLRSSQLSTWTDAPGTNENRPINNITWYEAMALCIWDGGYLPTQTEWNYAATGGDQQRAYPWSSPPGSLAINSTYASYGEPLPNNTSLSLARCFGDGMPDCTLTDLIEVGSKAAGDGRWGQSDLAGNVAEWTLDWYSPAPLFPCIDCANLTPEYGRTVSGGSFVGSVDNQRSNSFGLGRPAGYGFGLGARCARSAQ